MATKLDLDPALVDEAVEVGGRRTKKETVTEALREYIARPAPPSISTPCLAGGLPILTTDADFARFATILPIEIHGR